MIYLILTSKGEKPHPLGLPILGGRKEYRESGFFFLFAQQGNHNPLKKYIVVCGSEPNEAGT